MSQTSRGRPLDVCHIRLDTFKKTGFSFGVGCVWPDGKESVGMPGNKSNADFEVRQHVVANRKRMFLPIRKRLEPMQTSAPQTADLTYTVRTRDGAATKSGLTATLAAAMILDRDWRTWRLERSDDVWTLIGVHNGRAPEVTAAQPLRGANGALAVMAPSQAIAWARLAPDVIKHCFCWSATLEAVPDYLHNTGVATVRNSEPGDLRRSKQAGNRRIVVQVPSHLIHTRLHIPPTNRINAALIRFVALVDATPLPSTLSAQDLETLRIVIGPRWQTPDPHPLGSLARTYKKHWLIGLRRPLQETPTTSTENCRRCRRLKK
jgi:hypothetical protein